jgi:hypothetical protein
LRFAFASMTPLRLALPSKLTDQPATLDQRLMAAYGQIAAPAARIPIRMSMF